MSKSDLRIFIGADLKNFNRNIQAAQQQLVNFGNVAKSVGSSIKGALVGAFAVDSAQRFFSTMIDAGRGFEDQMARVKAVSNTSARNFQMMANEAKRLGETTRFSATEAGAALENLSKNGLSASNATKALSSVLELAGANAIGLAEAADIVTNTMNIFRLEVEDLNDANDILSAAAAKSATDITELYHALTYAGPTANQLHLELDEVNAALGILANNGIKGERAGTALRGILERLVNPSREAEKIMAKYGLTINETTIKVDRLRGTLAKLKGAGLSQQDLGTIFGVQASGAANILISNVTQVENLKDELANSTGAAKNMFEQGTGEFTKSINTFKSTFESALIKIFEALKPALIPVIDGFTSLIQSLTDLRVIGPAAVTGLLGGAGTGFYEKIYKGVKQYQEGIKSAGRGLENFINLQSNLDTKEDQFKKIQEEFINIQNACNKAGVSLKDVSIDEFIKQLNSGKIRGFIKDFDKLNESLRSSGKSGLDLSTILDTDGANKGLQEAKDQLDQLKNTLSQIKPSTPFGTNAYIEGMKLLNKDGWAEIRKLEQSISDIEKAFKKVETGNASKEVGEFRDAIKKANNELNTLPTNLSKMQIGFQKVGNVGKKAFQGLVSALGGPIMATITAVTTAIGLISDGIWKWYDATHLAEKALDETTSSTSKMKEEVISTVKALKNLDKGSTAWQMRMDDLKASYPELVEELKLAEVHLGMTEEGFNKVAEAMQNVLDKQSQMDLAKAAQDARKKLLEDYKTDSYGWIRDVVDFFGGRNTTPLQTFEEQITDRDNTTGGKLYASNQVDRIMQILGDVSIKETEKIKKIEEIIKTVGDKYGIKFDSKLAEKINDDFTNRVGKQLDSLKGYLNSNTEKTSGEGTIDIDKYVAGQHAAFEALVKSINETAPLKYTDATKQTEYIAQETQRAAVEILDTIINKFKGIKIEGKDARDLLLANPLFNAIAKAAQPLKINETGGGGTGGSTKEDPVVKAREQLAKDFENLNTELKNGWKDENEAVREMANAYNKYLGVLKNNGMINSAEYKKYADKLKSINNYYKALEEAVKDAAKLEEKINKNREQQAIKKEYEDILNRKNTTSRWDMLSDVDSKTNVSDALEDDRIDHLRNQLEDLKSLRDSISGNPELQHWVDALNTDIGLLADRVKELDDAFQLKNAQKELKEFKKEFALNAYGAFQQTADSIVSIGDALNTFRDLDEIKDGWERFVASLQAVFSIVDTFVYMAQTFSALSEIANMIANKTEAIAVAQGTKASATVAAIEAETAATVTGEAAKAAAIQTASASNIAAHLLQAEAANILMAAEAAAAFAGIPFVGPALAAAQIAEMKALIAAAASLPAFANGGIVGGNSYIGDKVLARVNSGEMILNQKQQKNLFSMLNNGSVNGGGQVKFKIEGKELVGVLKNYNNIKGKVQ